jgi:succinate-semialdehyde dehydrogenase/glutarate-semialdehyde dehydrogenase
MAIHTRDASTTASDSAHRPYATVNPYTGETVAEYPFLETAEVDAVVERAAEAFHHWRHVSVEERAAVLAKAADLMLERKAEFAALLTLEVGKLVRDARWEVNISAAILRYYADNGPGFLESQRLPVEGGEALIVNEPLGVLLGIEPWNFPLYQVARFAAPYLLVGNTILLKHAEICPQSALALERLFHDAGVPEGGYTNLFLRIADVERVIAHPAVQGVSLTGSDRAGASVGEIAGRNLKRCVLELGGSDPFIVLDAPDLDRTLTAAAAGRLSNAGQSCVAAKRFIVVDDLYDTFVDGLAQRFAATKPGDPSARETTLAPLSSERAATDLMAQVQDAVDKGATVVTGGDRPDLPGAFVNATILTDVKPGMRAYSEELFGPVAVVYRVRDDDEAVALANASPFGLGGSVFCSDPERARAVADRIDSGMVWINSPTSSQPDLPFGGVKRSGFGRELNRLGLFEFTNRKLIRVVPTEESARKPAG